MQKYCILVLFTLLYNLNTSKASTTRDSIGVENSNGKKVIIHKVVAKDTYYSIGRRYKVSPKVIMSYNNDKFLQINVIIKVPTDIPFNQVSGTSSNSASSGPSGDTGIKDETYITHIVKPKDNLNMLAEAYGTTVEEIKRINNLKTINLSIGQRLKMPAKSGTTPAQETQTDSSAQTNSTREVSVRVTPPPPLNTKPATVPQTYPTVPKTYPTVPAGNTGNTTVDTNSKEALVEHTVASNETIYSIATRYGMTIDQLKAKNNLADNSLHVGQTLLIKGQYPVKPAPSAADTSSTNSPSSLKDPSLKYPPSKYGLNQVDEKGTAIWIADQDLDSTKMLVLHRTAPIGTVIKITNPMSNRSTFAKVVGKFTENESTKDVIIVMTKAVADALGALDKRFFCSLTYSGQQENEQ